MQFSPSPRRLPPFDFDGIQHEFLDSARWLGLILDSRLKFAAQLDKAEKAGKLSLDQLERIIKPTFGLNTKHARTLVVAVVYSRLLFGSIAWFGSANKKTVTKALDLLHNRASRLVSGLFRQSPLPFVKTSGGLISLVNVHRRNTHSYIHKLLAAPDSHPVKQIVLREIFEVTPVHPSPVHLLLDIDLLRKRHLAKVEQVHPAPVPPWLSPLTKVQNLGSKRQEVRERIDDQISAELEKQAAVIFTDGSWTPGKAAGAAAVLHDCSISLSQQLFDPSGITNFETELWGVTLASQLMKSLPLSQFNRYKSVAIFSGNQGALLRINNPSAASSGQNLAMVANRTLRGLGLPVSLYWCPGHEGLAANERADLLAGQAAVAKSTATSPLNPLTLPNSIAKLNQDSRATFSKEVALTPKEQIRFGFRTNPKKITQALDALEKGVAATIFQLRADQAPLNHFLMRIRTTTDPRCRFCGEIENAAHFLRFCRKYTAQRQALRKRLRQEKIRVSTHTSKAILDQPRAFPALGDYILATNRFPHIKLYRIPDTTLDTT
ncbi:hypothetical protein MJO29_014634 [Puccinia striiformis f. sp. tritici]|nr:hypothetical protein MJO29_014634 [Puccinia striiformis f. sp. tritici]